MSYKLFLDKPTDFKCRIELEGASLKQAKSRIVIESTDKPAVLFEGRIDSAGNCVIPIHKIREFYELNDSGIMRLEVVADGMFFEPWQSEFVVSQSKLLRVEVVEQVSTPTPKMSVVVETAHAKMMKGIMQEVKSAGVTLHNIHNKKSIVTAIVKEYIEEHTGTVNTTDVLREVMNNLKR